MVTLDHFVYQRTPRNIHKVALTSSVDLNRCLAKHGDGKAPSISSPFMHIDRPLIISNCAL